MLKKTSFLVFITFTISTLSLFADKKQKEFNLKIIKSQVVDNSLYNQVEFIDSRPQHECMLISINDSTFTSQLQTTLDYMIDNTARDNALLLQLRHLYMKKESDEEMNIYAYINIYQKKDNRYLLLNTVNRRVKINNPDLTHDIITQAITQLLNNNLKNESSATASYLAQEIEKIDLIEKAYIKAYQTTDFVDGVYTNYEEFASQTPSITNMDVEMKKDQIKTIKVAMNGDSKMQKLDLKKNYAVVVNNIPYLIFKNKYIPITKEEDELILQIDQKSMTNVSFFLGGGLVGAILIPTNVKEESSTYMIDHLDGEVVLKEKKTVSYNKSIFSKRDLNKKDKTEYQ